jgi:hypothetical protein
MRTLAAAFILAAVAAAGRAEKPASAPDRNDAAARVSLSCRPELRSLCLRGRKPGENPLSCLERHRPELAPACREALDALQAAPAPKGGAPAARPAGAASCMPEFEKACKGVKSKELRGCLKAHRGEFSELCRRAVDGASAER